MHLNFLFDLDQTLLDFHASCRTVTKSPAVWISARTADHREMVAYVLDVLKRRGFRSVHIIVNRDNVRAIRCYAHFGFRNAGECEMYGQHFLCYEKAL